MSISMKVVGLGVVLLAGGACGSNSNDPCDGAASGTVCRWAGTGVLGYNEENPTANRLDSQLYWPMDLTFGPDGRAYVIDYNNHRVRRVEKDDSLVNVIGTGVEGDGPPQMEDRLPVCSPPGALGSTVSLNHPTGATFGPDGLLYLAAWHNNKIRVLDPDNDMVYSLAGDSYGFTGDGGPACQALFSQPKDVEFDAAGNMYIVDQRNGRIREVSPGTPMFNAGQDINTIAGNGTLGNNGDGGLAMQAQFGFELIDTPRPSGALVISGNLIYVADSLNNRIRRINLDTGIIDCIAGESAQAGYSGDGGPALDAEFNFPVDMALGPDGRLYVVERYNAVVRAIDLNTGIIETVVGNGETCDNTKTACPDRGPALSMELNEPQGITFDAAGNLYIADTYNSRIMKVVR